MKFYEKFTRLISITETSSAQLAKKLSLDPSQVSRMKTGARGKPNNSDLIMEMSIIFAAHCNTEYKVAAIAELTNNNRVLVDYTEKSLAETIFEWLSAQEPANHNRIDSFLRKVDSYSERTILHSSNQPSFVLTDITNASQYTTYNDNKGKRQAVLDMLNMLLTDNKPCDIYLYTDENNTWYTENPNYATELSEKIGLLAQLGYTFYRVNSSNDSLDTTIRGVEQWLPAYICGAVREYHYPFMRDDLHRRTLFVVPNRLALFSHSLARQTQSRITTLCTNENTVKICYEELKDIFALCRPMTRVYTVGEADALLDCLHRMAAAKADGIYKTASLSIPTMPMSITERIVKESNSPIANRIIKNQRERAELRNEILKNYRIEDIMSLADIEEVKQGKVPLPSTRMIHNGTMYYTPEEYKLHLQAILDSLEKYPNYQAIFTNNSLWKEVIVYAKSDGSVLMIKEKNPFALFEITESRMSMGMTDFLKHISMRERAITDRNATIAKLKEAIAKLS